MKVPLFPIFFCALFGGHLHGEVVQRLFIPRQQLAETSARLRKNIPRVDFQDTTLLQAVDLFAIMNACCEQTGNAGKFAIVIADPALRAKKIDLLVRDISMEQLLVRVAEITRSVIFINHDVIEFHEGDKMDPTQMEFAESAAAMAGDKIIVPFVEFNDTSIVDAVEILNQRAAEASGGASHPRVLMDASASRVPLIPMLSFRERRVTEIAQIVAKRSGHCLVADGEDLKIVKPPLR